MNNEQHTQKAFDAMWSEMEKLGFTPTHTTSGNDLSPRPSNTYTRMDMWKRCPVIKITIGETEIQIFTPNSLEQNLDNDEVNTYTIWHGDSDSWTGDPYGQTLYETIELIKGLKSNP